MKNFWTIFYTILITLVFAYSFHYTLDGIKGDFPIEYKDKYTRCEKCYPFKECDIEIKNPVNVMLDCNPHLQTIKSLNFDISDLKVSNKDLKTELKCFKDKYISWESYQCSKE